MTADRRAIAAVAARRVWDSRGRPTVEAEIRLAGGAVGRAIAPAGASTGRGEAVDLRDGGARCGGYDVTGAVGHVRETIGPALIGCDVRDQAALDRTLIALDGTPDKRRLGGNALVAVSLAALHAAAADAGQPLWAYLAAAAPGSAANPATGTAAGPAAPGGGPLALGDGPLASRVGPAALGGGASESAAASGPASGAPAAAATSARVGAPPDVPAANPARLALTLPLPQIQIFGGGAHAGGRIDLQDLMVTAVGASSVAEALDWTADVYRAAGARLAAAGRLHGVADEGGYWPAFDRNEEALDALLAAIEAAGRAPGADLAIALDVAASTWYRAGRYHLRRDGRVLDTDALADLLIGWIDRYPIVSIEDPLAEDDLDGMRRFTAAVGRRVQVVGDDLLVTNADRVRQAARDRTCTALLAKPNQAGTVTETRAAIDAARAAGFTVIVSARSGETEDLSVAHLAVGWGADQIKVGSFARSERMAKWNELLRIEEALGASAAFAGAAALGPGVAGRPVAD